jgi:hypothetical protein
MFCGFITTEARRTLRCPASLLGSEVSLLLELGDKENIEVGDKSTLKIPTKKGGT